jgi:hypothetical protein
MALLKRVHKSVQNVNALSSITTSFKNMSKMMKMCVKIKLIFLLVAVLKMRKNTTRDAERNDRRLHTYTRENARRQKERAERSEKNRKNKQRALARSTQEREKRRAQRRNRKASVWTRAAAAGGAEKKENKIPLL